MGDKPSAGLYFEAHITIEPIFDARRDEALVLARMFNFKLAHLLMQKRKEDQPEHSKNDTFMTGHGTSYSDLAERTCALIVALKAAGYVVWRYKIEDTICDSRSADVFQLLS